MGVYFVLLLQATQVARMHASRITAYKDKPPNRFHDSGVWDRSLTMTYSHMEKLHTTIGDASFHC